MPKVLVVDDEPDMRWLLTSVLRDQGFEVATAEDGQAALERISHEPPDIVLLDLKMPGLDGIQVLEQVKAVDPYTPVVIVTAYGDLPTAVQAIRLGISDYLTKPFDHDEILFTVRRTLEKRELEAARFNTAKVATLREVAHALADEINNALTPILGYAQLLERELGEAKAAQRLKVIIGSCARIAQVVRRLSSAVVPVATFKPGMEPTLDLVGSRTARGEATEHGKDPAGG